MQRSLFLLILMGQCCLLTCQLYKYHFINMNKSWQDAQKYCRQKYTDLVTVYDETDISRLRQSAKNQDKDAWVGPHNKPDGGKPEWKWRWSQSGVEYKENEAKWGTSQPNNRHGEAVCVVMQGQGNYWWDRRCTLRYHFICYDGGDSSDKFFWGDKPATWTEAQKVCREEHTDLLSGGEQLAELTSQYKLKPVFWIGLYRSFSDSQCAALDKGGRWKTDDCDSKKPFFCYKDNMILIKENKTWEEAIDHCRENYKDLISITDPGQQRWVQERAKKASSSHVWLGLHYTCVLDVWFWVTNERLIYQNWASDVETDDCDMSGALETRGGHKWSKEKDVREFNFFCSKV